MSSQWENFLKNLGEWHGSFAQFSPQGEPLQETPTIVSFEGENNDRTIRQTVRYLKSEKPPIELVWDSTSPPYHILFFEDGAFSQGSLQWGFGGEFGAELGLIEGNRRLRLVLLYNRSNQFDRLTLIREKLVGTSPPERLPLTIEQLIGEWQGEATTLYRDRAPSQTFPTCLKVERQSDNRLSQSLSFGNNTLTSTAQIHPNRLLFDEGHFPVQILFLPDGASANCPLHIKPGHPFILESGWLTEPNQRRRFIRSYDAKGAWVSSTLVKERKARG
ncbi:DUF3598 family protein [Lusitaniella coriacea]|uniref:DUF3598 family protein n=1 Tax=Lusitaniella coriacea TaxID=1983105 RepID=UPI003CF70F77